MVANGEYYQKSMESDTQFIRNLIDGSKTVRSPKLLLFFFKTLISEAIKKVKTA